ncbi:MAG: phage neck terminator protein, partial [Methylococcales bacterium]
SMANTSATGGYLLPTTGPIEGISQAHFFHSVIEGISGFSASLVRQAFQGRVPPQPEANIDWVAFHISRREMDDNSFVKRNEPNALSIRHERIEIQCFFYGPKSHGNAAMLLDGFLIAQNLEALFLVGMGFIMASAIQHVPELINGIYFSRSDVTLIFTAENRRVYPVLTFLSARGTTHTEKFNENFDTLEVA